MSTLTDIARVDLHAANTCCGSPYPVLVLDDDTTACAGCYDPETVTIDLPSNPTQRRIPIPAAPDTTHDDAEAALDDDADAYFERCAD